MTVLGFSSLGQSEVQLFSLGSPVLLHEFCSDYFDGNGARVCRRGAAVAPEHRVCGHSLRTYHRLAPAVCGGSCAYA